jgi:hypothetical protein
MAATAFGLYKSNWNCVAEGGIDCFRFENAFSTRQNTRTDVDGEVVSALVNGKAQTITCGGPVKDATGLMAFVLATAVTTLAGDTTYFGITTGDIIFTGARVSRAIDKQEEVEFTFMRWPLCITAA